ARPGACRLRRACFARGEDPRRAAQRGALRAGALRLERAPALIALPEVRAYQALRRKARCRRRIIGFFVLFLPTLWVVGTDLLRRAQLIAAFDKPHLTGYIASAVESLIFWGVLLHVASRRRGALRAVVAVIFVVLFTLATGIEGAFHALYNIYISM